LGPFHGAIAVPSVTRCRCRRRCGHRCAGGVRQYSGDTWWIGVRRLVVANGPNIFQMLLVYLLITLLPAGLWISVTCLSFCLQFENHTAELHQIFKYILPMTTPQSSDGVAIFYEFPVLWMTSCFNTTEPMGQNHAQRNVSQKFARWRYKLDFRQLECLVELTGMQHQRPNSGIYDWLVLYLKWTPEGQQWTLTC